MNTIFLRRVNLGSDAQVKDVNNQKVIEFSVADNRRYRNEKGEEKELTVWYRCSYWSNNANIQEHLFKGATVNIIGKLLPMAYINKNNQPACDLRVTVSEIDLLSRKEESETEPEQKEQEETSNIPY